MSKGTLAHPDVVDEEPFVVEVEELAATRRSPPPEPLPARLGAYRVLKQLAKGGMGVVYLAEREGPAGFSKAAVLKCVRDDLTYEPGFVEMFLNEARLAACLSHSNVVQVFELGQDDGRYFLAMEYVHGTTLRGLLRECSRVPLAVALQIAIDVLGGLHHAHTVTARDGERLEVVHRDVSPDNVLLSWSGVAKVTDFGIAKAVGVSATRSGTVKGKFHYMAPEQIESGPVDARADVYGLGVVLYQMLCGQVPYDARSDGALLFAVLSTGLPSLRGRAPEVPEPVAAVVERALAKDPAQRWASALAMADALEAARKSLGLAAGAALVAEQLKLQFGAEATLSNPGVRTPVATPTTAAASRSESLAPLPPITLRLQHEAPAAARPARAPRRQPRRVAGWVAAVVCAVVAALTGAVVFGLFRSPRPAAAKPIAARPPPPPAPPIVPPTPDVSFEPIEPPVLLPETEPASPAPAPKRSRPRKVTAASPVAPAQGQLDVRVHPWAAVFIDGEASGTTPMSPVVVSAGHHRVVVRNDELGESRELEVDVSPGATRVVRFRLVP